MANVLFKRGLAASLNNAPITDGVFYLTTDNGRLYVDINNERKLLNQSVKFAANIEELNTLAESWNTAALKAAHTNDFYYIQSPTNILATFDGTKWVQINPDHFHTIENLAVTAAATSNNAVNVTTQIDLVNEQGTSVGSATAVLAVKGGTGIDVGVDNGALTISGETYSLNHSVPDNKNAVITLNNSSTAVSTINLVSKNDWLKIGTTTNNAITLEVVDTKLSTEDASIAADSGVLSFSVDDTYGNTASATATNVGIVLNNGTYAPLTTAAAGSTVGALYSKAEIDNIINGLNGMTYKGTVGNVTGADVTSLPTTGVSSGDTYVIVKDGLTASQFTGANFNPTTIASMSTGTKVGDMLIARGTEVNGVITSDLEWTYIPAGNDSLADVTYEATVTTANNSLELHNERGASIAQIQLVAGTDVSISSALGANDDDTVLVSTINHASITTTTSTTAVQNRTSFDAIKSLTIDNGHVTNIVTDTFTPITFEMSEVVASTTANNGTGLFNIVLEDSAGGSSSANFAISSDTLKIRSTSATNQLSVNIEWGSF